MAGEDEGITWEAPSHWETELLHFSDNRTCRHRERKFPVIQYLQKKPKACLGLQFPVSHLMWVTRTRDRIMTSLPVCGQSAAQGAALAMEGANLAKEP